MIEKTEDKKEARELGTTLHLDDLSARADKPAQNLVPRKKRSHGSVRFKKSHGRIYYYWVRTVYRTGLPPSQEIIKYLGRSLPQGVRLGPVDKKMAKILNSWRK